MTDPTLEVPREFAVDMLAALTRALDLHRQAITCALDLRRLQEALPAPADASEAYLAARGHESGLNVLYGAIGAAEAELADAIGGNYGTRPSSEAVAGAITQAAGRLWRVAS